VDPLVNTDQALIDNAGGNVTAIRTVHLPQTTKLAFAARH
jgi:hypothetical protein